MYLWHTVDGSLHRIQKYQRSRRKQINTIHTNYAINSITYSTEMNIFFEDFYLIEKKIVFDESKLGISSIDKSFQYKALFNIAINYLRCF